MSRSGPKLYDELASLLDKDNLPSLLFVGPRGAGKTTLVRRIARGLMERSRGKGSAKRRLWATSADRIVAGMIYLGMWQERCLKIARELEGTSDVLFVDRLADAMAPMSDGASITDLLAPAIIAGELAMIAECDEADQQEDLPRSGYMEVEALKFADAADEFGVGEVADHMFLYPPTVRVQ